MEKVKIYARLNEDYAPQTCYFTKQVFTPINLIFEAVGESGILGSVSPEEAFKRGFIAEEDTFYLRRYPLLMYRVVTPTDKETVNSLPGAILTLSSWDEDYALPEPDIEEAIDKNGFWESEVEDIAIYQIYTTP